MVHPRQLMVVAILLNLVVFGGVALMVAWYAPPHTSHDVPMSGQIIAVAHSTAYPSALVRVVPADPDPLFTTAGQIARAAIAPDGTKVAFVLAIDGQRDIYVLTLPDKQLIQLTNDRAQDDAPAWAPDSQQLVFASDRRGDWDGYVVDLRSGRVDVVIALPGTQQEWTWAPDGQRLAFAWRDRDVPATSDGLYLVDRVTKQYRQVYAGLVLDPVWSPHGRWIAFVGLDGSAATGVALLEVASGQVQTLPGSGMAQAMPAWAPDESQLVYIRLERTSHRLERYVWEQQRIVPLLSDDDGQYWSPSWAP